MSNKQDFVVILEENIEILRLLCNKTKLYLTTLNLYTYHQIRAL